MMADIVNLADRREPVTYTVRLRHHWDGSLAVWVEDVADDERSRGSVALSLYRAAALIDPSINGRANAIERAAAELVRHCRTQQYRDAAQLSIVATPKFETLCATLAQAIEARRAETGTGSVEDESAVGNADAPKEE